MSDFNGTTLKNLASILDKLIIGGLLEKTKESIRDKKEKDQIVQKLNEFYSRYREEQYDYLNPEDWFDISGLHEWYLENLDLFVKCFSAVSYKERVAEINFLRNKLYRKAKAKTDEQKAAADEYINFCLNVSAKSLLSRINPEILFIFTKQTEDIEKTLTKLEKFILKTTEKLEALIKGQGPFEEFIDSRDLELLVNDLAKTPWERDKHDDIWFHYLNPEIGFVRRDAQFNYLDEFLKHEKDLLSLAITGYGGIGKTKLLHQYILQLPYKSHWSAVMLDRASVDKLCSFTELNYPKNLLLVIDYSAEKSEKIGEWLREVIKSPHRPRKMRIIFLERQGLIEANDQKIQPLWYQQMNEACGMLLGLIQYEQGNGFYELPTFTEDEMYQVMDMHPEAEEKLTLTNKKTIYKQIISFSGEDKDGRFNTPLIALLLVDAFINGKVIPDPNHLMAYVIERNKDSWERAFASFENRNNLVDSLERTMVYVTATGECDLTKLPSPLTDDAQLLINTLRTAGINQLPAMVVGDTREHHQLAPLKPDIIGEYFVLNYIDQNQHSYGCKEMVNACWEKPREFESFLNRCTRSYLGEFPHLVFDEEAILFQGADPLAQASVLFGMTILTNIEHCQRAVESTKRLSHKYDESQIAELLAVSLSMSLFNLSNKQEKINARKAIVDELKAISDRWFKNPMIALVYAMGLGNLSANQESIEALKITVDELKVLSKKRSDDAEIALRYARSLVNLSMKQEKTDARKTIVDELKVLSKRWPENAGIVLAYTRGLVMFSATLKEANARKIIVEKVKLLSKRWSENANFASVYARGLVILLAAQGEADARKMIIEKLKILSQRWPDNTDIAFEYASGLIVISCDQEKAEVCSISIELNKLCNKHSEFSACILQFAKGSADNIKKQNIPGSMLAYTNLEYLIQSLEEYAHT